MSNKRAYKIIIKVTYNLSQISKNSDTTRIIRIRKLYEVMVSDVKVKNIKTDTISALMFTRQDVA